MYSSSSVKLGKLFVVHFVSKHAIVLWYMVFLLYIFMLDPPSLVHVGTVRQAIMALLAEKEDMHRRQQASNEQLEKLQAAVAELSRRSGLSNGHSEATADSDVCPCSP